MPRPVPTGAVFPFAACTRDWGRLRSGMEGPDAAVLGAARRVGVAYGTRGGRRVREVGIRSVQDIYRLRWPVRLAQLYCIACTMTETWHGKKQRQRKRQRRTGVKSNLCVSLPIPHGGRLIHQFVHTQLAVPEHARGDAGEIGELLVGLLDLARAAPYTRWGMYSYTIS